jgi:hypothetical protein
VELAVVLARRLNVPGIDLLPCSTARVISRAARKFGDDVTIVALAHDRVIDGVALAPSICAIRPSSSDNASDGDVCTFPKVVVEAGFKHSVPTFAIEGAFEPVKSAR